MGLKFNPTTGQLDLVGSSSSGAVSIPEYTSDPASPSAGDAWVRHTVPTGAGSPIGLLLALTQAGSGTESYDLSYRTSAGTTIRVTMA